MQETWVRSLGWEDPLEKEMATHSSILAWVIPWTEEAGRLYSPWGHKELDTTQQLKQQKQHQGIRRLPDDSAGKESACNAGDTGSIDRSWVQKIPWRRAWQPTPAFLPSESHGQRSLVGYSSQGCKESDATEVTQHARMQGIQCGCIIACQKMYSAKKANATFLKKESRFMAGITFVSHPSNCSCKS